MRSSNDGGNTNTGETVLPGLEQFNTMNSWVTALNYHNAPQTYITGIGRDSDNEVSNKDCGYHLKLCFEPLFIFDWLVYFGLFLPTNTSTTKRLKYLFSLLEHRDAYRIQRIGKYRSTLIQLLNINMRFREVATSRSSTNLQYLNVFVS